MKYVITVFLTIVVTLMERGSERLAAFVGLMSSFVVLAVWQRTYSCIGKSRLGRWETGILGIWNPARVEYFSVEPLHLNGANRPVAVVLVLALDQTLCNCLLSFIAVKTHSE